MQGNPGEGKTYFAMRLAAACTKRKPLPGMETLEPFNIIYQTAEDGLGADVDMNRANEVRPIFRNLGDIAQDTGCAIVLIGHLNKASGTQSTYRGLGSIEITASVRSLLFIGKLKDSPTTRVLIHEKSSLAPPGQSLAFSLGDEKGFEWIGAYGLTADELLAGTDTAKTESKTAQTQMLILELLADGKRMPSAELEKTVNERGISSRTMRTAKSRIGDRLVTEKDGTAWGCYLRDCQQEHGKRGKDGKVFIDTLMLPPCLVPSYRHRPMMNRHWAFFIYRRILNEQAREQLYSDFKDGRALAFYEALDTIRNELLARDCDLKFFGLDCPLERVLSPRKEHSMKE